MVQLMNSHCLIPESEKSVVKLEIDESAAEERSSKRSKNSPPIDQRWGKGSGYGSLSPAQYNPLDEPSPLGLRLRKSPSLLDLIQMRLLQENHSITRASANDDNDSNKKKDHKAPGIALSTEKLKASNFPVSFLKIGSWERVSRYEGDLVAKCYFAKHKLVWEVLEGGLKSKIEIQWSDITAIRANCPDHDPGVLDIVLARPPLFFRETNPQPRKHTLWQATSDFTDGQASTYRRHFLRCPQGLLNKHFEKLIQCDPRLNLLSRKPEITSESYYFAASGPTSGETEDSKNCILEHLNNEYVPAQSGFHSAVSPCVAPSSSSATEMRDSTVASEVASSPNSVMESQAIDEIRDRESESRSPISVGIQWDNQNIPGVWPSMSMSDLVNHIGLCISEKMTASNLLCPPKGEGFLNGDMLDEIAHCLLSDSQLASASDEQCLMARVNSLCCLLQKDAVTAQTLQVKREEGADDRPNYLCKLTGENRAARGATFSEEDINTDASMYKQTLSIPRRDSIGDLLVHLPRIASLPQFLSEVSEDGYHGAR